MSEVDKTDQVDQVDAADVGESAAPGPAMPLGQLPEAVRARVVSLTAEVLPEVASLPPALRRVADFVPARRARMGAATIATALEDDGLRGRVARQVDQRHPDLAAAADAAPLDVAARAWLAGDPGLADLVEDAASGAGAHQQDAARTQRHVARLERTVRELREEHRRDLDKVREEHAELRRRLGQARAAAREAQAETEAARAERDRLDADLVEARERLAAAEQEARRLRTALERTEGRAAEERREGRRRDREDREGASARARLLLDTLLEAGAGLRRELALPAVEGTPGQRLEERLAGDGGPAAPRRTVDAAGRLEEQLRLPRARLLVDGYNVTKSAWPQLPLDVQRRRLLAALGPVVGRTGAETTVVFDGADAHARGPVGAPRGVRVVFSPQGVIADDVLGELAEAEPAGRVVLVVTGDRGVLERCGRAGARGVTPAALLALAGA